MASFSKSRVLKSKSSNSNIMKSDASDKKSWSSSQFRQNVPKRRGPYVVKEITAPAKNIAVESKSGKPKPRPARRKFVSKVLNILNKSTFGTQFPSQSDEKLNFDKHKRKPKVNKEATKVKRPVNIDDSPSLSEITFNNGFGAEKCSFMSTFLSQPNDPVRSDQLLVLRSKKDIIQTPSENSYRDTAPTNPNKFSEHSLEKLRQKITEIDSYQTEEPDIVNTDVIKINSNIITSINEGLMGSGLNEVKVKEFIRNDSIVRLGDKIKQSEKEGNKDNLYDLLIDVYETSYDVYNVNTKYEPPDEEKVKALEVKAEPKVTICDKNREEFDGFDVDGKAPSDNVFYIKNGELNSGDVDIKMTRSPSPSIMGSIDRKYTRKPLKQTTYKGQGPKQSRRQSKRLKRKRHLLNMFKEQLWNVEEDPEPENLYEALRLMARNKQKTLRFDDTASISRSIDDKGCMITRKGWKKPRYIA